jgi:hypothetical protein
MTKFRKIVKQGIPAFPAFKLSNLLLGDSSENLSLARSLRSLEIAENTEKTDSGLNNKRI